MCAKRAALRRAALLPLSAGVTIAGACRSSYVVTERGPQAYYQTGYPVQDVSRDLERIGRSVKHIQILLAYDIYRFPREAAVTASEVRQKSTYGRATERLSTDHAVRGTAAVIARRGNQVELITNDHITYVPDTIVVYFGGEAEGGGASSRDTRYVESVAIKTRQTNLISDLADVAFFRVVARDSAHDLALLAVDLQGEPRAPIELLSVREGDASKLGWGSFVYVIGFPQGFKMVTRGIVSDPNRSSDNAFLLDASFNRGISGGLILAVRGDTGALEWVGMARAASAHGELILSPERRVVEEDGVLLPYEGRLYIERVSRIDYGVTFSVPMTAIRRFLRTSGRRDDGD